MKPGNFLLLSFLIVVLISCTKENDKTTSLTFLRTSGQYMVNESNDTILLRGIGLGNWLLPEGYMWHFGNNGDRPRKIEKIISDITSPQFSENFWKEFRQNYITEKDIKKIAELGFNSVRPALNARVFMTEGDTAVFIEENFALLDSLVAWCGKYNIYVVLDMHGAPGGQTGQNIDDSPKDEPELFMDPRNEDRLMRLWLKLVDRYKDNPVVAGYDLLNEPLPENTGAAEKYKHLLEPMYKKLTSEIRKIDKKHMIILEGYNWANNWSVFGEPFDDNLVYQFHYYCWDNPDHLNDISYYLKERERLNVPVWVGETGERNAKIYFATTQYFEKNNIGWSFWPWKKIDNQQVIYSINAPEGYDKIIEYSRGGEKPSIELAEKALTQLLVNMKVENCEFREPITQSILRQVPGRIYAVNYGHDGAGLSYFVKTNENSDFYRTDEPVKILMISGDNNRRRNQEQVISLAEKEWTNYNFFSTEDFNGAVNIRAKAVQPDTEMQIEINGNVSSVSLQDTNWTNLIIDDQLFKSGENMLKSEVIKGNILISYFDIQ